ncbi:hypothetical protein [Bradyrhizobium sp. UFLA05-112]
MTKSGWRQRTTRTLSRRTLLRMTRTGPEKKFFSGKIMRKQSKAMAIELIHTL